MVTLLLRESKSTSKAEVKKPYSQEVALATPKRTKGGRSAPDPLLLGKIVFSFYSESQSVPLKLPVDHETVTFGAVEVPLSQVFHQITLVSLVVTNIRLPPL